MTAGLASAQTAVALPGTAGPTTLTANVSEQAQVTVPSGVTFNVTNVAASTVASGASVTVDTIVLATAGKTLKIWLRANAAAFTPPSAGASWAAGDVSWTAATFSNGGAGIAGALTADLAYQGIVLCAADVPSCSTTNLVFTLAPKTTVTRSGNHTLLMTWKFESI